MEILILLILFTLFFLLDYMPIIKSKIKKDITVYGVIYIATFLVIILHESNIDIPGPDIPIKYLINDILKLS